MSEFLQAFADFSTLLYHEARNVRHEEFGKEERYRKLVMLRRNKYEAWHELQPLRNKAANAETAEGVRQVFEQQFDLGLSDLVDLFQNTRWKDGSRGGNRWAIIARTVIDLSAALDKGDLDNAHILLTQLNSREMRHNTGIVSEKLRDLDQSLRRSNP
jgi:hypothetical protein